MNILQKIKSRATIRKYKDQKIPENIIDRIAQAGVWSSSIHGLQPWRYLFISNDEKINAISEMLTKNAEKIGEGINKLLLLTSKTIAKAPLLILVYNDSSFSDISQRFFKIRQSYLKIAKITEIQAIAASIQNMILVAAENRIGACWNTIPLFCEKELNGIINTDEELVGIITMGYPDEKGKRTPRKFTKIKVGFIR